MIGLEPRHHIEHAVHQLLDRQGWSFVHQRSPPIGQFGPVLFSQGQGESRLVRKVLIKGAYGRCRSLGHSCKGGRIITNLRENRGRSREQFSDALLGTRLPWNATHWEVDISEDRLIVSRLETEAHLTLECTYVIAEALRPSIYRIGSH